MHLVSVDDKLGSDQVLHFLYNILTGQEEITITSAKASGRSDADFHSTDLLCRYITDGYIEL